MRQMGTAIAGGFLGSMLFSGLSHGLSGTSGTPGLVSPDGAPGSRSSGFGVLEILLLGLVGYIGYRVWKNRQEKMALSTPMGQFSSQGGGLMDSFKSLDDNRRSPLSAVSESGPLSGSVQNPPPTGNHRPFLSDPEIGLAGSSSPAGVSQGLEGQRGDDADDVDEDQVKNRIRDVFYRVQTAWSRRDLKAVRTLMTPEMYYNLESDLSDLLEAREINRLENISIADVDLVKTWREEGDLLLGARIVAYMLDYTVNETSQAILKGSSTDPIRFEETWIFQKSTTGSQWMLAGIQVESAQKI